jgi:hypothetical protein
MRRGYRRAGRNTTDGHAKLVVTDAPSEGRSRTDRHAVAFEGKGEKLIEQLTSTTSMGSMGRRGGSKDIRDRVAFLADHPLASGRRSSSPVAWDGWPRSCALSPGEGDGCRGGGVENRCGGIAAKRLGFGEDHR